MKTLRECIGEARERKIALGHFNVSTLDQVWAISDAAQELSLPVIIGVSEGEREYTGVNEIAAIVRSIREYRIQDIFLNADHTYSFEKVKQAIHAGFDAVIFDGAKLSLEENISEAKKCVEYARKSDRDIVVEGELGYIGSSSKMLDNIPEGAIVDLEKMTKLEEARMFLEGSGVDMLAPAVGNIHGIVKGGDPALNIERIAELSKLNIPLVLHGASGNKDEDIRDAIKAGMCIVHINTELRLAYRESLAKSLSDDMAELAAYKYMRSAKIAMKEVVLKKMRLFSNP